MIGSGRKLARNVMAMASSATGEAPPAIITGQEISTEVVTAEPPEIVKKIQQAVCNSLPLHSLVV